MKRLTNKMREYFQPKPDIIRSVLNNNLTYLSSEALYDLYKKVKEIDEKKLEGILIEAGCALGGSAIVIASAKSENRPFYIYDVFGMIPPPTKNDGDDAKVRYQTVMSGKSKGIGHEKYYGYEIDLYNRVLGNFKKNNISVEKKHIKLIKGLFDDVLTVNEEVALAHLDGDWYSSIMTCLERITPYLVTGGTLIIDDYYYWSGCKKAVDDFFREKKNNYLFKKKTRLHITKK
jgi:hypothetical protein